MAVIASSPGEGHAGAGGAGETSPRPTAEAAHVARAELELAGSSAAALRTIPLRPDPLQAFASAVGAVRNDLGERAEVCLDLMPLTARRVRHLRRRAARTAMQGGGGVGLSALAQAVRELNQPVLGAKSGKSPRPRGRTSDLPVSKLDTTEPVFAAQLLLRTESEIPGRAQALLRNLIAACEIWAGDNQWRVAGLNLGVAHLGADSVLFRRSFDRRWDSGLFRPRHESMVTSGEIAGLLKPPTKHCQHANVVRSGGLVPAVPREVPVYAVGRADLVPLGYIRDAEGRQRMAAQPLEDLFFSFSLGKSRYGKTEKALLQAVSMARAGHGLWFLDPHADGYHRAKPYLCDETVLDRLWEVDLTVRGPEAKLPGYNPMAMSSRQEGDIEDRVDLVVSAFSTALNWPDSYARAKTILTKSVEALCHLAPRLPPEAAPTIFQIRTLLTDPEWREIVVEYLPPDVARYWKTTFERLPVDSTPVITGLIDRLSASPTLSAFLGSSRSTYNVREAMDTGRCVFVCPPGSGEASKLVTGILIYDLFRAGRSRANLPVDKRRRFDAFVDELAGVARGGAKTTLPDILEQLGKYGLRLHAMTQMADRLPEDVTKTLLQNQSTLSSTAGELDAVKIATRQWGKQVTPDTIMALPRFHHVISTTIRGQVTTPFRIEGAELTEFFADVAQPDRVPEIAAAADANLNRRRVTDTLADLAELDDQILELLQGSSPRVRPAAASPAASSEVSGRGSGRTTPVSPAQQPEPAPEATARSESEPVQEEEHSEPESVAPVIALRPGSTTTSSLE